jgi:hypothetical protein
MTNYRKHTHQFAGLKRTEKSYRLKWLNYLRPDLKHGKISPEEEHLIIKLHDLSGNRYVLIKLDLHKIICNMHKIMCDLRICNKDEYYMQYMQ